MANSMFDTTLLDILMAMPAVGIVDAFTDGTDLCLFCRLPLDEEARAAQDALRRRIHAHKADLVRLLPRRRRKTTFTIVDET